MAEYELPAWPAPSRVRAVQTRRGGGVSLPPWDSLNLGTHVGDDACRVGANRALLRRLLPGEPRWLQQVHGTTVVEAASAAVDCAADAAWTRQPGVVCAVMTADCLPVLFCDRAGTVVAAAHAGWRGLQAGVLEATLAALAVPAAEVLCWFGPAIGPTAFEVGDEVRAALVGDDAGAAACFVAGAPGKWLADLPGLARRRLRAAGVRWIGGSGRCTVGAPQHYFSYRRDGVTGRMATLIWLDL